MKITHEGWDPVDRQPVRSTLQGLDRAQTQAADQITVHLTHAATPTAPTTITIKQNPTALKGSKIRVGAAVWDGAYVLAAYLDSQPPGTFAGLRCVELGCGCGLLGLVLARLGAGAVYLTDKQQHLVGPRVNAAKNKLLAPAAPAVPAAAATAAAGCGAAAGANGVGSISTAAVQQQQGVGTLAATAAASSNGSSSSSSSSSSPAVVQVVPLDWEDGAGMAQSVAAITAAGPIDLIVASDCIYPDPDGSCPSSSGFMAAVAALATPGRTRVLTMFETRSDELRQALLAAAAAVPGGCEVVRIQPEQLPEGFRAQHVELYELQLSA